MMKTLFLILGLFAFLVIGLKAQEITDLNNEFIHTSVYIESYVVTDTTAYLRNADKIVYFSFFTYTSNTGRVMFDGRHGTFNGQVSEPVYIPHSTAFNNGDRIEMLNDSVTIEVPALDTVGLFLWRAD